MTHEAPGNLERLHRVGLIRRSDLVVVALLVLTVDQILKWVVSTTLQNGKVVDVLGGLVRFDYTSNTGAAFGIFQARGALFSAIALAVVMGIVFSFRKIAASPPLVRISLGLVLGGAIGNLIDRIRLGYVVDFIDLRWWPVFNIADSAIVIGVLVLVSRAALQPSTTSGE